VRQVDVRGKRCIQYRPPGDEVEHAVLRS